MEEFKKKLMELLAEQFDAERYSFREMEVVKNNDVTLHSICVTKQDSVCGVNIYVEEMYSAYQILLRKAGNENPWDKIMDEVVELIENKADGDKTLPMMVVEALTDYEYMKDKVVFRLINAEKNKKFLANKAYLPFLDLAICFYVLANEPEKEDTVASIALPGDIVKEWGVSLEKLYEVAKQNMMRIFPSKIESLTDMLTGMMGNDSFSSFMNPPTLSGVVQEFYILTNQMGINGAAVLCYDSVIRGFSDEMEGSNFYILPSSIHEVILIPDTQSYAEGVDELLAMVKEVNQTCVRLEEILADSVYYYERSQDKVVICAQCRMMEKTEREGE